MEYVEELLKNADFSMETDLKLRLSKTLFPKVRSISFDDLLKKNNMTDRKDAPSKTSTVRRKTMSDEMNKENTINPPKKDGPTL